MVNADKYLSLVENFKTEEDIETLEAFMYNRGKIVLDKTHLYQNYSKECIEKIKEVSILPVRKNIFKI
jgi:hypothetical protein